ncbi:MAG: SdiA-regulated domain-containing protein [Planctomycetes bacterium]|nr:SdiA-regulated domain-containing protein [Planctomycetota bacterium]
MLFRRSRRDRNSKKARTTQSGRQTRLCGFEQLEDRRLLAAFDLGSYEKNTDIDKNLSGTSLDDFSGAAYQTRDSTEWIYIIDNNASGTIVKYKKDGTFEKTISMVGFSDPEAITHITGDIFAVIEEKRVNVVNNMQEFNITIFTILPGTTSIDKNSLNQNAPTDSPPTSGIIKLTHADLNDGDSTRNQGPEGLAYDTNGASDGYFYFAKEKKSQNPLDNDVFIFRVPDKGGTVEAVVVDTLTVNEPNPRVVKDISDIYFVRTAAQPDGRLFVMSDESKKVLTVDMDADVDPASDQGLIGTIVSSAERSLPTTQYEGLTFSPDGFEMTVVFDGGTRHMIQYRNFTVLDPDDAPDLDDGSDTGIDDDNITTDTTPTFSRTLTRDVSGLTVPVKDAWVFLYKDGVATGDKDETDASGIYSITVGTALSVGDYDFTIRLGENSGTAESLQSPAANSEALEVNIVASTSSADLDSDFDVDFNDLTILLSNWNKTNPFPLAGDGNLVDASTTTINFNDLTVLLAAWTGPAPAGAPQAAWAAPSVEANSENVFATLTEFKVQFDAPVSGVDVSDLVLSGLGGAEATVDSFIDYGVKNVHGFKISGLLPGVLWTIEDSKGGGSSENERLYALAA